MGKITVSETELRRLLARAGEHGQAPEPYAHAFRRLADSHRGQPAARIVPLLRRAADRARLVFPSADFQEQAEAISAGEPYELRIHVR